MLLALRQRSHRPDAPIAMALWKALLSRERVSRGAKVLIPAPALAELIRGDQTTEPPMVRGIEIASFTHKTARILARTFPQSFIDSSKVAGAREHYVKYDALIAAIAIHRDATLVTLDKFLLELKDLPIKIRTPASFLSAQTEMPLGP
ncbi:MAG: type II toxin-antitoxin system VapC family toxin [Kofleriaceae bacterium]